MRPIVDHFAWVAGVYDRLIPSPDADRLERLLKLPVAGSFLDAGGGTGRASARFSAQAEPVIVSDLSLPMLKQAKRKAGLVPLQAHAERLPFADESFDRVLVVDALHHFCDAQEAIADLLRVLKPGGRMVIEEPDIDRPVVKAIALAEKFLLMGSRFYPSEQVAAMIGHRNAALRVRIEKDGRFVFWVVVDKPHPASR